MERERTTFRTANGDIPLPIFFPDATRAVVRGVDSVDIKNTNTPGILVNTYHLIADLGESIIEKHGGVRGLMGWDGGVISDSGGFQMFSLVHRGNGASRVTDDGIHFRLEGKKAVVLTPEKSVAFQMILKPDMVVVLDDFTRPGANYEEAKQSVNRTVAWAKRSKAEFLRICEAEKIPKDKRPYLLAVVQGDNYLDLRRECAARLAEIGFDGFGYGGWPLLPDGGGLNWEVTETLAEATPKDYFLYGLGLGKPEDVVGCVKLGFTIFDCVLPTRDARHGRLYVYNAESMEEIDVRSADFYSYFSPQKGKYVNDTEPVSRACDCLLCANYSRAYLNHLFKVEPVAAKRLATIHNLRFYSLLMEELRKA